MSDSKSLRSHGWLPSILGLALLVRLSFLFWWEPDVASDAADYVRIARDLINGEGFRDTAGGPTSFRAPLYPLFLAGLFKLSGQTLWVVRLVQSVLDVVVVAVVYRIAERTFAERLGTWVAPIAALLVALNLAQASVTQRVLSETLFTLLFVGLVGTTSAWWRTQRPAQGMQWAVASGVLIGLATLTRGVMIAYPFVLVAIAWVRWRKPPRGSLALIVCFVLTLSPWTLRNFQVHGAFVPVSTQVGITLYASYNPPDGAFGFQPSDEVVQAATRLPEPMASKVLTRAAIDTALANPQQTLRLEGMKTLYFWSPIDWELLPVYGAVNPSYLWIVLVAFLGWWIGPVRRAYMRHWPILLPVAYLFGMSLVFHGSPRYRLPAEPLLALGASATMVGLATKVGRRRAITVAVTLVLLCGIAAAYADQIRATVRPWLGLA